MRKLSQKQLDKQIETRVNEAYKKTCSNIPINIMDIGKVFQVGRYSITAGDTQEQLEIKIRSFVESIRQDR